MAKTKEEVARDARVKVVEDAIVAAKNERERKRVIETEAERTERLAAEAKALDDAREGLVVADDFTAQETEAAKELKVHTDARDARVKAVKDAIATAKVARDEQEVAGVRETEGVQLDRLAKEAKDLREASVVNVIEHVKADFNNIEFQKVADKQDEIIKFLNGNFSEEVVDAADAEIVELEELTKKELVALAYEKGIELKGDETKDELVKLLEDNQ